MNTIKGRFAPSPTGRMHLGNIWAALLSYLSVKSKGGTWILRHEDLDPQRSRREYALMVEDDLHWLGLMWDEGGLEDKGPYAPYSQSRRRDIYSSLLERLWASGMLYNCRCRRADLLASSAPHASDGRPIYSGKCRPSGMPLSTPLILRDGEAVRITIGRGRCVEFNDMYFGHMQYDLEKECGDFVLRRADGTFAYQLAVVADDAAMKVTQVVRGCDLLPSAATQIYLYRLLGLPEPTFGHVPLLCNGAGQRLSKRDQSLSMAELRKRKSPGEIIGALAFLGGIIPLPESCTPQSLIPLFSTEKFAQSPQLSRTITTGSPGSPI